ncbi:MAG: hypothetical protein EGMGGAKC_00321 [Dehalococcoides mccartyi]|nr:hypothetical protein [Dehalococcoides mccartyi]
MLTADIITGAGLDVWNYYQAAAFYSLLDRFSGQVETMRCRALPGGKLGRLSAGSVIAGFNCLLVRGCITYPGYLIPPGIDQSFAHPFHQLFFVVYVGDMVVYIPYHGEYLVEFFFVAYYPPVVVDYQPHQTAGTQS